jgi:hypothetical protein
MLYGLDPLAYADLQLTSEIKLLFSLIIHLSRLCLTLVSIS